MMHARQCADVREQLEAFHDGELSIDEQVAVQGHLGECVACALLAAELDELSRSLRDVASAQHAPAEVIGVSRNVIERLRVEAQFSVGARLSALFQDMHLVWAGLGATLAMFICIIGSASVLHAASQERPDSLAALIAVLANPGSNANPVSLDAEMMVPRARSEMGVGLSGEDAAFALAAVVTREGRIQNLEVLAAEYASTLKVKPEVVVAMLNEASRAQFEPAQARAPVCRFNTQACGVAVAVNLVWLVTSTTVKGREDAELRMVRGRWAAPPRDEMGPALLGPEPDAPVAPAPVAPETKPTAESRQIA